MSQYAKAHEAIDPRGLKVEEVTKYELRVLAQRPGESFAKGLLEQWEQLVAGQRAIDAPNGEYPPGTSSSSTTPYPK